MAWGAKQSFTQDTTVGNTWTDAGSVSLNPRELIHVQWLVNNENASTVTDAAELRVLATLDDATEDWDDTPVFAMSYEPSTVNEEAVSFSLSGYYRIKIQYRSAGSTDNYTFDVDYRLDGVSA